MGPRRVIILVILQSGLFLGYDPYSGVNNITDCERQLYGEGRGDML